MSKRFWCVSLLLALASLARPDGCHISNQALHLHEPLQKAVISFNRGQETMLLSSMVQANELLDFAWLVPVPSVSDPRVSSGDAATIEAVVAAFNPVLRRGPRNRSEAPPASSAGVQLIQETDVGLLDVAVLRATSSADLFTWLKRHGYSVPKGLAPVLEHYTRPSGCYFVASRVNLKDRHAKAMAKLKAYVGPALTLDMLLEQPPLELATDADVDALKNDLRALERGVASPIKIRFRPPRPFYPLEISSLDAGPTRVEVYVVGPAAFEDVGGTLRFDDLLKMDAALGRTLTGALGPLPGEYITRLVYGELRRGDSLPPPFRSEPAGEPIPFQKDAVFTSLSLPALAASVAPLERAAAGRCSADPVLLEGLADDASVLVRVAVAANASSPAGVFVHLAKDSDPSVRRAVQANAKAPAELLLDLASHGSVRDRIEVAANLALHPQGRPDALWNAFIHDPDVSVRDTLVHAVDGLPAPVQVELARDPDVAVRAGIAARHDAPAGALVLLAGDVTKVDPSGWASVRDFVARNPAAFRLPVGARLDLADAAVNGAVLDQDPDPQVRIRFMQHSGRLPATVWAALAKDDDSTVSSATLAEILWRAEAFGDAGPLTAVLDDPAASPDFLLRVAQSLGDLDACPGIWRSWDQKLAMHSHLSLEAMVLLASPNEPGNARRQVASRPDLPGDLLDALSQDPEFTIRLEIAGREGDLPGGILRRLAQDPSPAIRLAVAHRHDTPAGTLELLSQDKYWDVEVAARQSLKGAPK